MLLQRTERVGRSIEVSRASDENENEKKKLRTHKIEGGNCGGVGREAWSAIRIIQRKRGLLEYEGDVRRRPGEEGLPCAPWGTRVASSSASSSTNFSSGRCGFPFSAQESRSLLWGATGGFNVQIHRTSFGMHFTRNEVSHLLW